MSTTLTATRSRRYTVAISNIFGSSAFCVLLISLADLLYRGGPILQHAESSVVLSSERSRA